MFRHLVRHVVKPNEFKEFTAAFKEFNSANPAVGVPAYRLYSTLFGNLNEVWAEAEYDSLDTHVEVLHKAAESAEWLSAFRAMIGRTVPGTIHDYPLEPVELD